MANTIPLTVLMHEGPQGRAYLAAMRHAGLRPQRIILMVYKRDQATGKQVGGLLPRPFRISVASRHHNRTSLYWVRQIPQRYGALFDAMSNAVGDALDFPGVFFEEIQGDRPLSDYSDTTIPLLIDGFRDPNLASTLREIAPAAVLFTGGGLVPRSLLTLTDIRMLHIHPGLLPHVRGADGILWSMLVRGRPGASCFYMVPGLDEGGVTIAQEFEPIRVRLSDAEALDDQMLYRAIFSFLDPPLRARLLLTLLSSGGDLKDLPTTPQDVSAGVTYHFMNSTLRRAALRTIFTPD